MGKFPGVRGCSTTIEWLWTWYFMGSGNRPNMPTVGQTVETGSAYKPNSLRPYLYHIQFLFFFCKYALCELISAALDYTLHRFRIQFRAKLQFGGFGLVLIFLVLSGLFIIFIV